MNQPGWATTINDTADTLIISSRSKIPFFNKIIFTGFVIFIFIFAFFASSDMSLESRMGFFIVISIPVAIGLGLVVLVTQGFNRGTGIVNEVVLDKKLKTLSENTEKFSIKTDEIKEVKVGEDTVVLVKIPRLRLILKDGEKTLLLNFESYAKAQEAKAVLEKYL